VRDAVDRMSAGLHMVDYWGKQVVEMLLGPPEMLAAAIDKSELEDMVLNILAGRDHSPVVDSLAEVLLLRIPELGK
jgi:hypothetical protein